METRLVINPREGLEKFKWRLLEIESEGVEEIWINKTIFHVFILNMGIKAFYDWRFESIFFYVAKQNFSIFLFNHQISYGWYFELLLEGFGNNNNSVLNIIGFLLIFQFSFFDKWMCLLIRLKRKLSFSRIFQFYLFTLSLNQTWWTENYAKSFWIRSIEFLNPSLLYKNRKFQLSLWNY